MLKLRVVIVGTMFANKTIHGPFDADEQITNWVTKFVGNQPYEIVDLLTHGGTTPVAGQILRETSTKPLFSPGATPP